MSDGQRFSFEVAPGEAGGTCLVLHGCIDEYAELPALLARIEPPLTVDLSGVEFINSEGVRDWANLLRAALRLGPVTLRGCSEPMVHLFNMVTITVDGTTIESFQAPYSCASCGREASVTLDVARDLADGPDSTPPDRPCAECSGSMRFAELPGRYLAFLEPA
jgi:anti-anti-sigma regulatory factor